jgi:transposase
MEHSPFLPLPAGLVIGQVELTNDQLMVEVISTSPSACCPRCGNTSDFVHCQYHRTVFDVPCAGRRVVLHLAVRKFSCHVSTCSQKVFAERLVDLVCAYARVSNRLLEELKALGLAASAEVNERLTPRLGMKVKASTLLRYLRRIPDAPKADVTVLGIDDFALRRGGTYGTILVNLETGQPLGLLPDRTADAVLPWLESHQEITLVSRDRASAYADAAKRALPQATQIADRYHLVQNLREHLQRFLDRKRTSLPEVEDIPLKILSPSDSQAGDSSPEPSGTPMQTVSGERAQVVSTELPSESEEQSAPASLPSSVVQDMDLDRLTYAERKKKISRDKRYARYEHQLEQMNLNDDLRAVYRLSQEFVLLLRERQAEALDSWLLRAKACKVAELTSFVNGIRRDYAAVRAACSLPWSNGTTEGQVNRLKFLKRQMFGRAHLDLLRIKVLHAV